MILDRTALVTGATGAIGKAIAVALARRGCSILLSGRSLERLNEIEAACIGSPQVVACGGDLTDGATLAAIRRAAETRFSGGIGIIVHAAGDLLHREVERVEVDDLRRLLEVNVVAAFALLRELTPILAPDADIVLLNSTHGVTSPAGVAPYAATKYALRALADSYRAEVNDRRIRVTSVFCGKTASEMQRRIYEQRGRLAEYETNQSRMMQPEDIAEVVVSAVDLPRTIELTEIYARPLNKT